MGGCEEADKPDGLEESAKKLKSSPCIQCYKELYAGRTLLAETEGFEPSYRL